MDHLWKAGVTSRITTVDLSDPVNGGPKTGLTSGTVTVYYARAGNAAPTAITMNTITNITDAYQGDATHGGLKELDATHCPGLYRFDVPDDGGATGATAVKFYFSDGSGNLYGVLDIELVPWDPQDNVRLGMTALPNVASGSAGAIPTTGTGANQINVSGGRVDSNTTYWGGNAIAAVNVNGVPKVDLVDIDGQATNGNNATLHLKRLDIQNNAGPAVSLGSSAGDGSGHGIYIASGANAAGISVQAPASGNAPGIEATGVGTGHGALFTGGDSDGAGMKVIGGGAGNGLFAASGSGATGSGIYALAASSAGDGITATGATANGNGIQCIGGSSGTGDGIMCTGGATGHGIHAIGGSTSGNGMFVAANASVNGDGLRATGAGTGVDIRGNLTGTISSTVTANVTQWAGSNVAAVNSSGVPVVDVKLWAAQAVPTPNVTGVPKIDALYWLGTALATPDTVGYPKVTIKSGTGTGELSLSSGAVPVQEGTGPGQFSLVNGGVQIQSGAGTGQLLTSLGGVLCYSIGANAITNNSYANDTGMRNAYAGNTNAATSTTLTLNTGSPSSVNDHYKYSVVQIMGGAAAGESRTITGYNGTTKVLTVSPAFTITPDAVSSVTIRTLGQPINVLGDVLGNVAGNVAGSVASVTAAVTANVTKWSGSNVATPNVAGVPLIDIYAVNGSNTAAVYMGKFFGGAFVDGVVSTGSTTIIQTNRTEVNDWWLNAVMNFTSGALQGVSRRIAAYSHTNGTFTVEALPQAPSTGDKFIIIGHIESS